MFMELRKISLNIWKSLFKYYFKLSNIIYINFRKKMCHFLILKRIMFFKYLCEIEFNLWSVWKVDFKREGGRNELFFFFT